MSEKSWKPGRMVWREVMTNDTEKVKGFYGELFGWSFKEVDMPGGPGKYTMIETSPGKTMGGIGPLPPGAPMPYWVSWVSVPDVDASVAAAKPGGGAIPFGPFDAPGVGRMAFVADPDGAVLGVIRGSDGDAAHVGARPGRHEFCWETLVTKDPEKAKAFYAKVAGWEVQTTPSGFSCFAVGATPEDQVTDIQKAQSQPPMWMTYVTVEKIEASNDRVTKLGGKVVVPLIEIPTVGRISMIADPTGAHIGLYQPLS